MRKNLLDPHLLQGWMCCEVVWESLSLGGGHWHLPNLILDQLWTTIPESILFGQHRSRCYQYFGGVFVLSRKLDSRWLLRQFPDLSLRCQIHQPLDLSGQILLWTQIEHPKSDCHHALRMTYRHWSRGLVCSSLEDCVTNFIRPYLYQFSRSQWLWKALEKTFWSVPVTFRGDQ